MDKGLKTPAQLALNHIVYAQDPNAGGWRYEYRVREALTVWPTQVAVLNPTLTPVLTLITCVNWDTQRLVVVADLVSAVPIAEE